MNCFNITQNRSRLEHYSWAVDVRDLWLSVRQFPRKNIRPHFYDFPERVSPMTTFARSFIVPPAPPSYVPSLW